MTFSAATNGSPATRRCLRCVMIVLSVVTIAAAQESGQRTPLKVTACQLKKDPPTYNHKLVEITGFVTHASHNFTIYDPTCPTWPAIWLEYGGTINSGTVNCCKTLADRHRSQPLVVDDVPVPLTVNQQFEDFDRAIQPPLRPGQSGAVEHATLIGTFFAGQQMQDPDNGHYWGGYGYMGCCSMLAIQEVKDPDSEWHPDLDYGESNEKLDSQPGCNLRPLLPAEQDAALLQAQHEADSGTRDWAFTDPARVASDALSRVTHISRRSTGPDQTDARHTGAQELRMEVRGEHQKLHGRRQPPLLALVLCPRPQASRLGRRHRLRSHLHRRNRLTRINPFNSEPHDSSHHPGRHCSLTSQPCSARTPESADPTDRCPEIWGEHM